MKLKRLFYKNKFACIFFLVYLILSIPAFIKEVNQVYLYHNEPALWQILATVSIPYYILTLPITILSLIIFRCSLEYPSKICSQFASVVPIFGIVFYLLAGVALDYFVKRTKTLTKITPLTDSD